MGPLRGAIFVVPLLVLLVAQSEAIGVRRRLTAVPNRSLAFASPDYTVYHRKDDLLREVDSIVKANPGSMKVETFIEANGNYSAEVKVVTVEPGGFTQRQRDKVRLLLDFGEHGRELISSELGLLLLRTLADPTAVARVFPGNDANRAAQLQRLLRGTVFKILPMENEGGRRLVESGRLCERKNGRGVDPNRNWLVDWGKKEPDYDPNEEYPGTEPFSEPESKVVRKVATEFAPQVWLNIHSGMEAMLAPWDHKAEIAAAAQPAVDMLQVINRDVMANTSCVVGSGGKSVGYLAHGTATDYMFEVLKVPIAFTWEIYGDFQAHFDDCFRMFNPLDQAGTQTVLLRWLRAIMRLVELLPTHPALKDSKAWAQDSSSSATSPAPAAATPTTAAATPAAAGGDGAGGSGRVGAPATSGPGPTTSDGANQVSSTSSSSNAAGGLRQPPPPAAQHGAGSKATVPEPGEQRQQQTAELRAADGVTGTGPAGQAPQSQAPAGQAQGLAGPGSGAPAKITYASSGSGAALGQQQPPQAQTPPLQQQPAGGDAGPGESRLTVVSSRRGWDVGWSSELISGFLAVSGLAVVGILAFRCLARTGPERRRVRGDGYQTV